MEIKNGVGITEDRVFIRMPHKDNRVGRAVRVILQSSGVAYTTWEEPNKYDSEITKYLNLVEPKQLPTKDGSVIKNAILGDGLGSCTIPYAMRVDGQWVGRCSCNIVAEPAEQYITNWEEV